MAAPFALNLSVNTSTSFDQSFTLTNDDGSALNLTGYTILAQIRKHSSSTTAVNFSATAPSPTSGVVKLELQPSDTASLKPGRYVYDIVITDPSSVATRVVEGSVIVSKTVSRD